MRNDQTSNGDWTAEDNENVQRIIDEMMGKPPVRDDDAGKE